MKQSLAPDLSMKQDEPSRFDVEAMDKFLFEYIYDYEPELAAIRCGIKKPYAKNIALGFLDTQYFQLKLKEYNTEKNALLDDTELLRRDLVRNLLDILRYNGAEVAQSARIAASKEITALMGLANKQESNTEDEFKSGVMVVPASLPVGDWSNQAIASQAALHKQLEASL